MSWLDPNWKYHSAATHGDSQAFAERQKMRAIQAGIDYYSSLDWSEYITDLGASYGDSTYRSDSSGLELRCTRGKQ